MPQLSSRCSHRDPAGLPVDQRDGVEAAEADQNIAIMQRRNGVSVGKFVAALARAERIFFNLHVPASVPLPSQSAIGSYLADEIAVQADVGMWRVGETARDAPFDLWRKYVDYFTDGTALTSYEVVGTRVCYVTLDVDAMDPAIPAARELPRRAG